MASQKLPNCCVGVYAYLRCILRHCGVPGVRFIPQDSESRRLAYLLALHLGLFVEPSSMMTYFEPFQDRLSRDIRNSLSTAFLEAVASLDLQPVHRAAALYLDQAIGECYRAYIAERLHRYEKALAALRRGPAAIWWRAAVLWDLQLFFEAHELLEQVWIRATGKEKLLLQAMIRAAGVYIKLEYGYQEAAVKMAGRALPVLAAHRSVLASFFDPEPLLDALRNPTLPPSRLLG